MCSGKPENASLNRYPVLYRTSHGPRGIDRQSQDPLFPMNETFFMLSQGKTMVKPRDTKRPRFRRVVMLNKVFTFKNALEMHVMQLKVGEDGNPIVSDQKYHISEQNMKIMDA